MEYWQKRKNYRRYKNDDGSFRYMITVDGKDVEVCAEVYEAYAQSDRRERYCAERDAGRLLSLDMMDEDDASLLQAANIQETSVEGIVIDRYLIKHAVDAFLMLNEDERKLLLALIIQDVSERKYAKLLGLSPNGIKKRRIEAIKKLKKLVRISSFFRLV